MINSQVTLPVTLIPLGYLLFLGIGKDIFIGEKLQMKDHIFTSLLIFCWLALTLIFTKFLIPSIKGLYDTKYKLPPSQQCP